MGKWAQGFAEYERHKNLAPGTTSNTTRNQWTVGGLVGIDKTFNLNVDEFLSVGFLAGGIHTKSNFSDTADVRNSSSTQQGGFVGAYASYTRGRLSFDFIFKTDLLRHRQKSVVIVQRTRDINTTDSISEVTNIECPSPPAGTQFNDRQSGDPTDPGFDETQTINSDGTGNAPTFDPVIGEATPVDGTTRKTGEEVLPAEERFTFGSTRITSYNFGANVQYRVDLENNRWWEPTGGLLYTFTDYGSNAADLGLKDGHILRLQAGARIGKDWQDSRRFWTASFLALAYSDVLINGFVIGTGVAAGASPVDEGKLRGLGRFEISASDGHGTTIGVQAEVRGGEDVIAGGGKLNIRYEW